MIGITGSTGVLGALLGEKLQRQNIIFSCFEGDVCNAIELENWVSNNNLKAIFHFAAKVPVDFVNQYPFEAIKVNVGGCVNLLNAVKNKSSVKWLLYASTSHVYRSSEDELDENSTIEPINFYGKTKLMGEEVFNAFASETQQKVCIARIFSFYHEKQKPPFLYPNIKNRLATEDLSKPFKLFGASSVRDLSNAEDLVDKLFNLFSAEASGTYNIGSGKGQTILDFVRSFAPYDLNIEPDSSAKSFLVANISKYNSLVNG